MAQAHEKTRLAVIVTDIMRNIPNRTAGTEHQTARTVTVTVTHSNTHTQYLLMNVTNAQTLKKGTRNETEVMEN